MVYVNTEANAKCVFKRFYRKRKRVIDIKLKLFSDDFHGWFEAGLYVNRTGNYMFKVNIRNS